MIRSMTGFGEAAEHVDGVQYAVELRSLNNRYFKASLRLPEAISGLEAEVESLLRKKLSRGSVTLTLKMHAGGASAASQVNDEALLTYLDHLETIRGKITLGDRSPSVDLTALLALPGVLQSPEDDSALLQRARPVVMKLVDAAADRVLLMRATEGKVVADDLAAQQKQIMSRLEEIVERAPAIIEEYHQKLRARIDELLARAELSVAEPDLIREVALFADKADISEELSRLSGHLEHFQQVIASADQEPAGRTLDFLAQELLREANTITSKSNDSRISRAIVEVKSCIGRIKEQVQNVE